MTTDGAESRRGPAAGAPLVRLRNVSSDAGFEMVNGHRCHKVVGMAAAYYPSGQITNVRQVTVWIDEKTLLIRKVLEDTPKAYPAGGYSRVIVTLTKTL